MNSDEYWFKGWLQTWLVHMRNPFDLYGELGPKSFLIAQVLFGGMVISAAVHPVFIGTLGWVGFNLVMGSSLSTFQSALLVVDTINIVAGYVSFWMLGRQSTPHEQRAGTWRIVIGTPIYWMMMSYASWRSLVHLYRVPHLCGLMYQEHQAVQVCRPVLEKGPRYARIDVGSKAAASGQGFCFSRAVVPVRHQWERNGCASSPL